MAASKAWWLVSLAGSFIYHLDKNQVYVGFVVHLNYKNPHLFPYMEFQRFKHHPMVADLLEGGKRVAYGARAISEGGYQSMPKMVAPGVALLGCSVGMVNVPRIKGNHNAMLSGIAAAEAAIEAIAAGRASDELTAYEEEVRTGEIGADLKKVRNVKPIWSKRNVAFSFTNHEESQPAHLTLRDAAVPVSVNLPKFAGPSARYCPAGVYEFVEEEGKDTRFVINFQNCVHCKTCDIKDPAQNIVWTTPQGGDGPNYPNM